MFLHAGVTDSRLWDGANIALRSPSPGEPETAAPAWPLQGLARLPSLEAPAVFNRVLQQAGPLKP